MKKFIFTPLLLLAIGATAQNPVIRDQFSADPTAREFNGKIYLYPSHDILVPEGQRKGWFCMEDYHVFSSENLTDWKDHGVIVTQNKVPWVRKDSYSMWAPDCVYRNGKYYFYFPSAPAAGGGFAGTREEYRYSGVWCSGPYVTVTMHTGPFSARCVFSCFCMAFILYLIYLFNALCGSRGQVVPLFHIFYFSSRNTRDVSF